MRGVRKDSAAKKREGEEGGEKRKKTSLKCKNDSNTHHVFYFVA